MTKRVPSVYAGDFALDLCSSRASVLTGDTSQSSREKQQARQPARTFDTPNFSLHSGDSLGLMPDFVPVVCLLGNTDILSDEQYLEEDEKKI